MVNGLIFKKLRCNNDKTKINGFKPFKIGLDHSKTEQLLPFENGLSKILGNEISSVFERSDFKPLLFYFSKVRDIRK